MKTPRAVALLSGGLDSATCLYIARERGFEVEAISFNYQQRHSVELTAARKIAAAGGANHTIIDVNLRAIGASALTAEIVVPKGGAHLQGEAAIPSTYVPVRNLCFFRWPMHWPKRATARPFSPESMLLTIRVTPIAALIL
jgi:7-cyano-7-deazaguanine synthase